jgi:DNA ligase-1
MYMSEKLDGQRCLWDGGITKGLLASTVPFANISKHDRFITETYATGLWSRYGQPIQAPDWFLNQLPVGKCLDGELYAGRGNFQDLGHIRSRIPDSILWAKVRFAVFNSPSYGAVFQDGRINNTNFQKTFKGLKELMISLSIENGGDLSQLWDNARDFHDTYESLLNKNIANDNVYVLNQVRLPYDHDLANRIMQDTLDSITSEKGEGLILRAPFSFWTPKRHASLLKVKKLHDAEAKVIGYTSGRETDKGSKLLGKMGALVCVWKDVVFELSGFTEAEREWKDANIENWCSYNPGQRVPFEFNHPTFPLGSEVTFRYREVTKDGLPREARFWRRRD